MAIGSEIKRIMDKACVSTSLLCEFFGVTRQTLSDWEKRGCPKAARGYWNVADVIAWREGQSQNLTGKKRVEDLPLIQQKIYWETRCKEELAANKSMANAVLRGDYLEKQKVQFELGTFFVVLKQAMMGLPRKVAISAAQYVGNERARKLENEVMEVMTDALDQWSQGLFGGYGAVDSGEPANPEAAGAADGVPVGGPQPPADEQDQQ